MPSGGFLRNLDFGTGFVKGGPNPLTAPTVMTTPDPHYVPTFPNQPEGETPLTRPEWLLLNQIRVGNSGGDVNLLADLLRRDLLTVTSPVSFGLTAKAKSWLASAPASGLDPVLAAVAAGKTALVVTNENMLGYVSPLQPLRICVLHASVLKGASPYAQHLLDCRSVRLAKEADFAEYYTQFGQTYQGEDYAYDQSNA